MEVKRCKYRLCGRPLKYSASNYCTPECRNAEAYQRQKIRKDHANRERIRIKREADNSIKGEI